MEREVLVAFMTKYGQLCPEQSDYWGTNLSLWNYPTHERHMKPVQTGRETLYEKRRFTLQLGFLPEVIKALKAPWVLECQLVVEVPEQEGHENDEESDGSQKPQHLWRDWATQVQFN